VTCVVRAVGDVSFMTAVLLMGFMFFVSGVIFMNGMPPVNGFFFEFFCLFMELVIIMIHIVAGMICMGIMSTVTHMLIVGSYFLRRWSIMHFVPRVIGMSMPVMAFMHLMINVSIIFFHLNSFHWFIQRRQDPVSSRLTLAYMSFSREYISVHKRCTNQYISLSWDYLRSIIIVGNNLELI